MTNPIEPSAAMRVGARAIRELYVALVAEGFTEQQALSLVALCLAKPTD